MSVENKAITLQQAKTLYDDLRQRQENIPSAENIVMVQDQQPTVHANKVWLTETPPAGVDVPTYEEFTGVIAPDYADLDFPVSAGEHCIHNGVLYTALQNINSSEEWTAAHWESGSVSSKLTAISNAIQGKYEKPSGGIPATDIAPGVIPTVPTVATQEQIKGGTDDLHPIAPIYQHESVFYALAKLAGVDMSQSINPVGQFTNSAKTAIQKMLGIYEAPWELIREDTVTNATEANIEITVDGDGEDLELTDIRMVFWLPKQDVQSAKGDYGRIFFYYDESNSDVAYLGAWQQAVNASAKGGYAELVHDGNMIIKSYTANTTIGSSSNIQTLVSSENDRGMYILTNRTYSKIVITAVTGTAKYRLFGRRKWN